MAPIYAVKGLGSGFNISIIAPPLPLCGQLDIVSAEQVICGHSAT